MIGTGAGRSKLPGSVVLRAPLALAGSAGIALLLAWIARPAPLSDTASGYLVFSLMLLALAYGVRRRTLRVSLWFLRRLQSVSILRPLMPLFALLDRLRSWRIAHFVLGSVWALALWWHVAAANGGWLEGLLLLIALLTLISGVLGAGLQYWLPRSMLGILERDVRIEDVDQRRAEIFVRAEERILGQPGTLVDLYLERVRPILQGESPRWRLFEALVRQQDPGAELRGRLYRSVEELSEKERPVFQQLIDLAELKGRLDLNLFYLEFSTSWLLAHDVLVATLCLMVTLHLLGVGYY